MALDLQRVAKAVVDAALQQPEAPPDVKKPRRGLSGGRAVLVGAGLVTAARVITGPKGREMLESLQQRIEESDWYREDGEPEGEAEEDFEDEEPEGEAEEDFEDEEPEGEADEDFEDEEPEGEADEDFEDEAYDEDLEDDQGEDQYDEDYDEEGPEAEADEPDDEDAEEERPTRARRRRAKVRSRG
jgi:hypothetical protein